MIVDRNFFESASVDLLSCTSEKLLAKVARQGKVRPLITKGGLKSYRHNLSIGLKGGPIGSTIQIAK